MYIVITFMLIVYYTINGNTNTWIYIGNKSVFLVTYQQNFLLNSKTALSRRTTGRPKLKSD